MSSKEKESWGKVRGQLPLNPRGGLSQRPSASGHARLGGEIGARGKGSRQSVGAEGGCSVPKLNTGQEAGVLGQLEEQG